MSVRTRFAPSPTGFLHVGGARTALFAWLFARQKAGQFILRIEDTDKERSTRAASQGIIESLKWLSLDWDNVLAYQSDNLVRYTEVSEQLLNADLAYHCHCSKERLLQLKTQQLAQKLKPKYDNKCRDLNLAKTATSVVRLRNPLAGKVNFVDGVFGEISVDNGELDDLILIKPDGFPSYNFAAVVDDHDMGISHVIRGDDHLNNTPRQINLLTALAWPLPEYAHLPMILGADGKRLSKRLAAVNVMEYQRQGILPQAMLNYLVRLGWSHHDQEVFKRSEMIANFSLAKVHKAPATFDHSKLLWFNRYYLNHLEVIDYSKEYAKQLQQLGADLELGPDLAASLLVFRARGDSISELAKQSLFLYVDKVEFAASELNTQSPKTLLLAVSALIDKLQSLVVFEKATIAASLKEVLQETKLKFPELGVPIRIALTGSKQAPAINEIIYLLGLSRSCQRLGALKTVLASKALAN